MEIGPWQILWIVCGLLTVVAAVLAHRGQRWRYLGRAAVGGLFLVGGATFNFISIVTGLDYADFADTAHFQWVTDSWRAVVGPNQELFIGLLVLFEAAVGILILTGGRRTQVGYLAVMAFYSVLWLFGGFQLGWALLMLPFMYLLYRAERQAAELAVTDEPVESPVTAGV